MNKISFTFGDSKEAALYFDHIIPLGTMIDVITEHGADEFKRIKTPDQVPWAAYCQIRDQFYELLPDHLKTEIFYRQLGDLNMAVLLRNMDIVPQSSEVANAVIAAKLNSEQLLKCLIATAAIANPSFTASAEYFSSADSPDDDVQVTIANLNLIDASKASMEQILSFRQDKEAQNKLRRLRLFAKANYSGKSRDFIEDDLLSRVADYEAEVRRWSFETKCTAISMMFRSKVLAGATGASFIGAIMGEPGISIGALAVGAVAEFGNITVEVARKRFEARAALRDNPVSHIVESRKVLGAINA